MLNPPPTQASSAPDLRSGACATSQNHAVRFRDCFHPFCTLPAHEGWFLPDQGKCCLWEGEKSKEVDPWGWVFTGVPRANPLVNEEVEVVMGKSMWELEDVCER